MIRLISGVTRKGSRLVYPGDGPFELTAQEERHLVRTGAAEYVTKAPQAGVATAPDGPEPEEAGDTPPASALAPEGRETPHSEGGGDDATDLPDGVAVVDGHMTMDSLLKMTKNDLLDLAADMDLKVNGKMSKDAIAAMISGVEVSCDDDAVLPELTQEEPTR